MSRYIQEIDADKMHNLIRDEIEEKKIFFNHHGINAIGSVDIEKVVTLIKRQLECERENSNASRQTLPQYQPLITSTANINQYEGSFFAAIRKLKKYKNNPILKFFWPILKLAKNIFPERLKYENGIRLNELLQFNNADFIYQVYRTLLKREPDSQGFNKYIEKLISQKMHKIEIIGLIRYSQEGKINNVPIIGLRWKYLAHRFIGILGRLPLIGYIVHWVLAFLLLPRYFRHINFEIMSHYQKTRSMENLFTNEINQLNKDIKNTDTNLLQVSEDLNKTRLSFDRRTTQLENATKQIEEAQISKVEDITDRLITQMNIINHHDTLIERNEALTNSLKENFAQNLNTYDEFYAEFEDNFRGSREEIKKRQEVYLPYIITSSEKTHAPILDLGSGRGEWLELLKEHGIPCKGIELNSISVDYCKRHRLDVHQGDGIDYLKELPDECLGGITVFQVIEHLYFSELLRLVNECQRVLKPDGVLIFETPNPENLIVASCNFRLDPTHRNPIPPKLLQFIANNRGYKNVEILRLHPYNFFSPLFVVNESNQELTSLFTQSQDYALVAWK